jgi:Xaa-Pro aminopeptidase
MIVNDTGCEYGLYTADVTRSYPVSGRFSPEQRAIYELVLAAQEAGLARVKPGAVYHEIYDATVEVIVDGLLKLGLLSGARDELLRTRAYKTFYPHGCCHWIGLNVHDPSSYQSSENGEDRLARYASAQAVLQVGMLTTVEPGIYIPEGSTPDKRWWNVGVRIEDTVLVTPTGHECLSCAAPRALADVERALSAKRR